MCWLFYASVDRSQIPNEHMKNAHKRNDDAWGLMYAQDGKVIIIKDKGDNHEAFRAAWLSVPERTPVVGHFRMGTSGSMEASMAHPFPVLEDEDGNVILAMAHNGVLSCVEADKETEESDTAVLLRDVIIPQLVEFPDLVRSPEWRWTMGEAIGNPNKLIFMNGEGEVFIVNDYQGKWHDGEVWYSNEYSIEPPKVQTYSYGKSCSMYGEGDWSNYGSSPYYGGSGYHGQKASDGPGDGWHYSELLKKWVKYKGGIIVDGMDYDKKSEEKSRPTLCFYQGEWYKEVNGVMSKYTPGAEPIDNIEPEEAHHALMDEEDVAEELGEKPIEECTSEREAAYSFLEQVYDMSEAEVYNHVVNTFSPETLTDIILELAGGRTTLYR